MWKGGLKFSRHRIGKKRKISKRVLKKLLYPNGRYYINDPQSLMNQAVTFCLGKLRLGFKREDSEDRLLKLIKKLRKEGYGQYKIDHMVMKATNRYRFGFEVPRMVKTIRGMLKEDRI